MDLDGMDYPLTATNNDKGGTVLVRQRHSIDNIDIGLAYNCQPSES